MAKYLNERESPAKSCRWCGIRRRELDSQTQYYWCGNFLCRLGIWALTCSGCPAYEEDSP